MSRPQGKSGPQRTHFKGEFVTLRHFVDWLLLICGLVGRVNLYQERYGLTRKETLMRFGYKDNQGNAEVKVTLEELLIISKALPAYKETCEYDFEKDEVIFLLQEVHVSLLKLLDAKASSLESSRFRAKEAAKEAGILIP